MTTKPLSRWSRRLLIFWVLGAVCFALSLFAFAPLGVPVIHTAHAVGASAEWQRAGLVVVIIGGVLATGFLIGLLGSLVCGIGLLFAWRASRVEKPAYE
jgi:hypothetical protein